MQTTPKSQYTADQVAEWIGTIEDGKFKAAAELVLSHNVDGLTMDDLEQDDLKDLGLGGIAKSKVYRAWRASPRAPHSVQRAALAPQQAQAAPIAPVFAEHGGPINRPEMLNWFRYSKIALDIVPSALRPTQSTTAR
jgi:hypothetical protein